MGDGVGAAHVDVDLGVLVDRDDLEATALEAEVLAEREVDPGEPCEVVARLLVVEGGEDLVGVDPDRQLRRLLVHQHEERRDGRAHRRLGCDEQARQVDRASCEVFRLNAVARGGRRRELGARVVLELGEHDDHDRYGAEHHDERHAALAVAARAPATAAHRGCLAGGRHGRAHWVIPKVRGSCIGRKSFVVKG